MSRKFTIGRRKGGKEKVKLSEVDAKLRTSTADSLVGLLSVGDAVSGNTGKTPSPTPSPRGSAKPSPRGPSGPPLFGKPLEEVMARQRKDPRFADWKLPVFLKLSLEYIVRNGIAMEGIFRVSGQMESIMRLHAEVNDLDAVPNLEGRHDLNAFVVSSLFKQYLRELPEPLLTYEHGPRFLEVESCADQTEKIQRYRELVADLPEAHRDLIASIMHLLHAIADNVVMNKMSLDNLARVIGPNTYWAANGDVSLEGMLQLNGVLHFLAENSWEIFEPPVSSFALTSTPAIMFRRKLPGHSKSIQCVALSSDKRTLWSADSAGICRLHDVERLEFTKEAETGLSMIFGVVAVDDTMWLGSPQSILVLDAASGESIQELMWFGYSLCHVGDTVWNGGEQKIRIWDAAKRTCLQEIMVSPNVMVFSLMCFDGRVYSGCSDNVIRVYDAETADFIAEFPAHGRKINSMVAVRATGNLWTCSDDCTICVWDMSTYKLVHTISEHTGKVLSLSFFGSEVWSCSWDKKIIIWDVNTYQQVGTLPNYHEDAVSQVLPVFNGSMNKWQAWSGSWDKSLTVWDLPKAPEGADQSLVPPSPRDPASAAAAAVAASAEASLEVPVGVLRRTSTTSVRQHSSATGSHTLWVILENTLAVIPDGREIEPEMGWTDAFEPAKGAVDALAALSAQGVDVRIWTALAEPQVVYWKMLWVESRLGKNWVERMVIAPDLSVISLGARVRVAGAYWPPPVPPVSYALVRNLNVDAVPNTPAIILDSWADYATLLAEK